MKLTLPGKSSNPTETFGADEGSKKLSPTLIALLALAAVLLLGGGYWVLFGQGSNDPTPTANTAANNAANVNPEAMPAPTTPPTLAPSAGAGVSEPAPSSPTNTGASGAASSAAKRQPFKPLVTPSTTTPGQPVGQPGGTQTPAPGGVPTTPAPPGVPTGAPAPTPTTPTTPVKPTKPGPTAPAPKDTVTFRVEEIDAAAKTVTVTVDQVPLIFKVGESGHGISLVKIDKGKAFFLFGTDTTPVPLAQGQQVELESS